MTIQPTPLPYIIYTGSSLSPTSVFAYPWSITAETDLIVEKLDLVGNITRLTDGVDYTVSGVGYPTGGNVTLTAGNLPNGYVLAITDQPLMQQQTLLQNGAQYSAAAVMAALDLACRQAREAYDLAKRGMHTPTTEARPSDTTFALPSVYDRAGGYLAFDMNGLPTIIAGANNSSIFGTVAATQVPYAASSNTLAGSADLTWVGYLSIGGSGATYPVAGKVNIGQGRVYVRDLMTVGLSTASGDVQYYLGSVYFQGNGAPAYFRTVGLYNATFGVDTDDYRIICHHRQDGAYNELWAGDSNNANRHVEASWNNTGFTFRQDITVSADTGTGNRPIVASAAGKYSPLANGVGALTNDGSGNLSWTAAALSAFWSKISNASLVQITGATTATKNRMHQITGTSADYTIIINTLSPSVGDVVGFTVSAYADASKQYTLDAGNGALIAGRTRYLVLTHANVALLMWDGANWLPLVLNLDSPWVQINNFLVSGTTLTAITTAPTLGTVTRNVCNWRRNGSSMHIRYEYVQSAAGTAGSGNYLIQIPIGTIDSTMSPYDSSGSDTVFYLHARYMLGDGYICVPSEVDHAQLNPYDSTHFRVMEVNTTGASGSTWGSTAFAFTNTNLYLMVEAQAVPMTNW